MSRSAGGSPLGERIQQRARDAPRSPALVDRYTVTTFGRLWRDASACADFLTARGVEAGQPIGLLFTNRAQLVAALLGTASVGAVAILLPPSLPPKQLHEYCRTAAVRLALAEHGLRRSLLRSKAQLLAGVQPGVEALAIDVPTRDDLPRDAFIGQLTSGVDTPSKIAVRTLAAVWDEIEVVTEAIDLNASDRVFVLPSISHSYGLIGGTLAPLCQGARVILGDRVQATSVIRLARRLRPTVLLGVPSMYRDIVEDSAEQTKDELSSLRLCLSAGAPLSEWINERFQRLYGRRIAQDYGCTEAGTITLRLEWTPELADSVGRPLRGRTVTVVDAHGRPAAPGEVGEIIVHSPSLARWYLESSGPVFISDGLAIGDLGRVDDVGHLFLAGRKSSLIRASGRSIDPAEIEAVIAQMPGVRDVAVVGMPTSADRERIKAVVVGEGLTTARILEYCRRRLPPVSVPEIVHLCDTIPRTPAGKVLRRIWRGPHESSWGGRDRAARNS